MTAREPAIASAAADWLEAMDLDVYEEVMVHGRRADLVGVGGYSLVVVECKLRLGLDLIEQAQHWKRYAHAVWCAFLDERHKLRRGRQACRPRGPRTQHLALDICKDRGIGVLAIDSEREREPKELVWAALSRSPTCADYLRQALAPEARRGVGDARAGTNRGGYHTPFRRTAELVASIVAEHPDGIDIKSILALVRERGGHHYASDRGFCTRIPLLVKRGLVPGVGLIKTFGRRSTVLRPVEVSDG